MTCPLAPLTAGADRLAAAGGAKRVPGPFSAAVTTVAPLGRATTASCVGRPLSGKGSASSTRESTVAPLGGWLREDNETPDRVEVSSGAGACELLDGMAVTAPRLWLASASARGRAGAARAAAARGGRSASGGGRAAAALAPPASEQSLTDPGEPRHSCTSKAPVKSRRSRSSVRGCRLWAGHSLRRGLPRSPSSRPRSAAKPRKARASGQRTIGHWESSSPLVPSARQTPLATAHSTALSRDCRSSLQRSAPRLATRHHVELYRSRRASSQVDKTLP
mmetsp:Transcript_65714/g.212050  ORF Transcript_65714/g.212050 Transcript_65714/m.212050 type:complete len:278 (-) Transcript_65714:391-1224(-)